MKLVPIALAALALAAGAKAQEAQHAGPAPQIVPFEVSPQEYVQMDNYLKNLRGPTISELLPIISHWEAYEVRAQGVAQARADDAAKAKAPPAK
jgi:hypothetical protein